MVNSWICLQNKDNNECFYWCFLEIIRMSTARFAENAKYFDKFRRLSGMCAKFNEACKILFRSDWSVLRGTRAVRRFAFLSLFCRASIHATTEMNLLMSSAGNGTSHPVHGPSNAARFLWVMDVSTVGKTLLRATEQHLHNWQRLREWSSIKRKDFKNPAISRATQIIDLTSSGTNT